MENHDVLTFTPVENPDPRVQRVGFDLTDPYVEQCWGPVVGPSAMTSGSWLWICCSQPSKPPGVVWAISLSMPRMTNT